MKALRFHMGQEAMARWGGWWRNQWRANRRAVLDAVWDCEQATKQPRNPGAWMRDRYLRLCRAYTRTLGA